MLEKNNAEMNKLILQLIKEVGSLKYHFGENGMVNEMKKDLGEINQSLKNVISDISLLKNWRNYLAGGIAFLVFLMPFLFWLIFDNLEMKLEIQKSNILQQVTKYQNIFFGGEEE